MQTLSLIFALTPSLYMKKTMLATLAKTIGDKRDPVMLQTFLGHTYHLLSHGIV